MCAKPVSVKNHVKVRVLLADDHMMLRQALASMLAHEADIEVVGEASNGLEALELCRRIRPDVVIMDLSMPVMDGIEATRRVAAELPGIRIIALSMFDSPDDVVELHQAGAALFLSKAGPAEDLIAAVRGHAVPGLVSMENQAKVRVLLADDHTMMRQVLASTLEHEADIEVVGEASNGLEVLDLCRTMRPDVVIMDLSMPIMDGIEATRRIATELPGIRVIALSMFDDPSDVVELHQAGAALFLSKSGPAEDLIAAVRGRTAPRREE